VIGARCDCYDARIWTQPRATAVARRGSETERTLSQIPGDGTDRPSDVDATAENADLIEGADLMEECGPQEW
jgi:hypothetical protein